MKSLLFVSHSFLFLHDIYNFHGFCIQYPAQYRQRTPSFQRQSIWNGEHFSVTPKEELLFQRCLHFSQVHLQWCFWRPSKVGPAHSGPALWGLLGDFWRLSHLPIFVHPRAPSPTHCQWGLKHPLWSWLQRGFWGLWRLRLYSITWGFSWPLQWRIWLRLLWWSLVFIYMPPLIFYLLLCVSLSILKLIILVFVECRIQALLLRLSIMKVIILVFV